MLKLTGIEPFGNGDYTPCYVEQAYQRYLVLRIRVSI